MLANDISSAVFGVDARILTVKVGCRPLRKYLQQTTETTYWQNRLSASDY